MSIHFFLTSKILFLKISLFQNFVSFFLFYFYFIFFKKKFPENFFTVHWYCSPYCSPKLQYNLFIAIHFQQCIAIQYTFLCNTPRLSCNTPSFPLQYNPIHYTLKLQYNPCIAIQFFFSHCTLLQYNSSLLQYTYPAYLQASLQYNSLYCNTIFQPNKPSCNTIT